MSPFLVFRPRWVPAIVLAWATCLSGCWGFAAHLGERTLSDAAVDAGLMRFEVDAQTVGGISDMVAAPAGHPNHFWLLPERQRGILSLDGRDVDLLRASAAHGERQVISCPAVPVVSSIVGVTQGLDTEAFALLSPNMWLLGTESILPQRTHDAILMVEPRGSQAHVVGQIDVPWELWGLRANSNEGIEGLCAAQNTVLVSGETVGRLPNGGRFAPLGRRGMDDTQWTPFSLRLTSKTGKISSLACRLQPLFAGEANAMLEVVAIERHYRVSRILRFFVPLRGPGSLIEPTDLFELSNWLDPLPNFESIAWLNEDTLLLVSDNSMAVRSGATEALVVPMQNLAPVLPSTP